MTEETSSLVEFRRGIALALVLGEWEGDVADLIPQEVWDGLFEERLLIETSDVMGEAYPFVTPQGRKRLREMMADV